MTASGILLGTDPGALRRKSASPRGGVLWRYLVTRWEGIAARVREEGKPFDQGALAWHGVTPMIVEAAVIARLTGRDDARAYVWERIAGLLESYGAASGPERLEAMARGTRDHRERPKVLSHGEAALAAATLGEEALPESLRERFLAFMRETVIPFTDFDHGLTGRAAGGNVALCRNVNAAIGALLWGAAARFPQWESVVDRACDAVRQYLRNGCDEAGASYEGAGYGDQVMQFIFLFAHLLRGAGWHDDLLREEPRLRRIPAAYQALILPGGHYAATNNDSGHRSPVSLWWMLLAAREWDRPDYRGVWEWYCGPEHPVRPWGDVWPRWAALSGGDPRMVEHADKTLLMTFLYWEPDAPVLSVEASPEPTAFFAEGTGTATFRTGWGRDALFATLLGGGRSRGCTGHAHADCGHIGIALGNEFLAIDTGRYNTNEDQHSVVLIDGANRHESATCGGGMVQDTTTGWLRGFQRHPLLDYAIADATHMKSAVWALRHFFFVRTGGDEGYVVLFDNLNTDNGAQLRDYLWQLQCAPTTRIALTGAATATVQGGNARIDCAFFTPPSAGPVALRQDEKEWVWPYGKAFADTARLAATEGWSTSVRRPRLLAGVRGWNGQLLTVLSVRRGGAPAREIRPVPVRNGLGVEIRGDGVCDTFLAAPDHRLILCGEGKCFSEFALIRRDERGHRLGCWSESGEPFR